MAFEKPFVSILTDFGFKFLFADPTDTFFLRKIIQIMILSEIPIKEVHIENTHKTAEVSVDRGAIYDVSCTDDEGREFVVEMQRSDLGKFIYRVQFYAYFLLNEMVEKGGKIKYNKLRPIYTISFLDGIAYPSKELYHHICLRNQHGELINDQITHIMLELGKWNKAEQEVKTDLDKLILLMKFTDTATVEDPIPEVLTVDEWTVQILEKLKTNNLTSRERVEYKRDLVRRAWLDDVNELAKERERAVEQKAEVAEQKVEAAEQKADEAEQKADEAEQKAEAAQREAEVVKREAEAAQQSAIKKLLQKGILADENIAELFDVDIEHVQQIKNGLES